MRDDYCIVSENNPLMRQYELVRDDGGLLISRKQGLEAKDYHEVYIARR